MKVAIDVDDVIANWYKSACKFSGVEYKNRNHWDVKECSFILDNWEAIKKDEEFWYNLEKLNDINFEFECYITSLPPHLADNRLDWLSRHNFPPKPIYFEHEKAKLAEELGIDVIIDDKPQTVKDFIAIGKHAIHYLPYYTTMEPVSPYFTRELDEVPEILAKIKKEHYV